MAGEHAYTWITTHEGGCRSYGEDNHDLCDARQRSILSTEDAAREIIPAFARPTCPRIFPSPHSRMLVLWMCSFASTDRTRMINNAAIKTAGRAPPRIMGESLSSARGGCSRSSYMPCAGGAGSEDVCMLIR